MALASGVKIEIEGVELEDYTSLELTQSIYGMNKFKVVTRLDALEEVDGFILNNSTSFIGSAIVINIDVSQKGDGSEAGRIVFKGLITDVQGLKVSYLDNENIILSGSSPEFLLEDIPGCRSFVFRNLDQIVNEVLSPYPRDLLKCNVNPRSNTTFEYTVQYNESCYQFLRRLATRYGEWMFYDGTELHFGQLNSTAATELVLGLDQTSFDFKINLKPLNFKYSFFDYINNETIENQATKSKGRTQQNEIGALAFDKSAKHAIFQPQSFVNNVNVSKDNYARHLTEMAELKEGAQAAGMSTVQGSSLNPLVKLGGKVKIKALKVLKTGETDYGEYIITELKHYCDNLGSYKNEFQGVSAKTTIPDYTNPEVKVNCEPQTAMVTDNRDPEKLGRIRVRFLWEKSGDQGPWIRVTNLHSGVGRGVYFTPDIGDEVLVGFEGNNPERPFVIGSVYNGNGKPGDVFPQRANNIKGLIFNGLSIQFNEESGTMTIQTPDKKQIILSDQQKSVIVEDENKNKFELSTKGISMNSSKDLVIQTTGSISITAGSGIDITAGEGLTTMSGGATQVTSGGAYTLNAATSAGITAGTSASVSGGVSAELKGATTTIQGALVKIN
ncbi:phage baseplate assembly protein V [Draconibacterium sp. IB214405]|uniref:type VI secretion system Vgr family protein n=1 Tax=Draconibacterium sp. IB214405 TaxID=3097352 RepID=UPI002A0DC346|nr:phage baseplate assembly protein V [Draconibacterium sp. IB214405]MDX8340111.1 phage baseplate assembly protein V [Draconibacterium sp. IB214405]